MWGGYRSHAQTGLAQALALNGWLKVQGAIQKAAWILRPRRTRPNQTAPQDNVHDAPLPLVMTPVKEEQAPRAGSSSSPQLPPLLPAAISHPAAADQEVRLSPRHHVEAKESAFF